jgi:hypothetical protein
MGTSRLLALVAVTAWACGGTTATGRDAGGGPADGASSGSSSGVIGSSGGGDSGGSSGGSVACPAGAPAAGAACPVAGAQCEYGDNPNVSCNVVAECGASGWIPAPTPACPSGTCPASYSGVGQSAACSPSGLDCAYLEGQCNCSVARGAAAPTWQCFTAMPKQLCPEPRPRAGSACYAIGTLCDYGACSGGVALICEGSYWQISAPQCH